MHKLHDWSKKVLWQRFWLDLCTKQVVSARACANQLLSCSSSGIVLFGMRTVQADSCFNSEQIDTLSMSVGGLEGGLGGWVVILGRRPKIYTWLSEVFYHASWWQAPLCVRCLMSNTSTVILVVGSSKQSNWAAPACCYQAWLTSIPPPLQMHNSLYRR